VDSVRHREIFEDERVPRFPTRANALGLINSTGRVADFCLNADGTTAILSFSDAITRALMLKLKRLEAALPRNSFGARDTGQ
jgi:uncharacterized membrane protein